MTCHPASNNNKTCAQHAQHTIRPQGGPIAPNLEELDILALLPFGARL